MLQHFSVLNAQEITQLYSTISYKTNKQTSKLPKSDIIKILDILNQDFNTGLLNKHEVHIELKLLKYSEGYLMLSEISGT